ncbi:MULTISPECIES: glucose-1-phosphate thymidylyltransferase [unclassified Natrinema]|uniref:glucose-1-phosphate thymidylyltransferase n=1 Tax=unclassified Natrinema TaxID=2622230 RepID=UPI00026D47DF|nr:MULTISPECIES: glucose-1-phosphate thymidylyltransferase [unclassified Natrinema]AFO59134.1 putative dTDP-glucose pyrophosphorylase [Natrinema sp. J7-2]
MKGVVLAGGEGSRLRPITHAGPKQLVPVANKPVMEYVIEDMVETGIDELGVVLGNKGRDEIQAYFGDGSDWGASITYIVQGEPLGLAHAVGCAKEFVGDDQFVVYLGDDLIRENIERMVADFDPESCAATVGLRRVEEPSRYGIADTDERGDVVGLVEKPENPSSDLALVGVYAFTPAIFDQIQRLETSWRGEYELTDAIQGLFKEGHRVQSHIIDGWWQDVGKPKDVLNANRYLLRTVEPTTEGTIEAEERVRGRIEIGPNSVIEAGAEVQGPVSIGRNTTIGSDSLIGPYTSIGNNCVIDNVQIESSVVIGNSTIDCDSTISDSLIARGSDIISNGTDGSDKKHLIVGQDAHLEL